MAFCVNYRMKMVDVYKEQVNDLTVIFKNKLVGKPLEKLNGPIEDFIMAEMKTVSGVIEELQRLESMYKKEQEAESDIRGDVEPGFSD